MITGGTKDCLDDCTLQQGRTGRASKHLQAIQGNACLRRQIQPGSSYQFNALLERPFLWVPSCMLCGSNNCVRIPEDLRVAPRCEFGTGEIEVAGGQAVGSNKGAECELCPNRFDTEV